MAPSPTPANSREELHEILVEINGNRNVYFQPPESLKMVYPAIVYARDYGQTQFASNLPYRYMNRYQVTVIDRNPDSLMPKKVAMLPMCSFSRHFASDELNHDVFSLYYKE